MYLDEILMTVSVAFCIVEFEQKSVTTGGSFGLNGLVT